MHLVLAILSLSSAALLCAGLRAPTGGARRASQALFSAKKRTARRAAADAQESGQIPPASRAHVPQSANQRAYAALLNDPAAHIVVAHGPAGTGKTLLACAYAAQELLSGRAKRVVLTRPAVAVEDEQLGFLPGDVAQKMAPYTQPLMDALQEICSKKQLADLVAAGAIEVAPLAFMRGRTFKDAVVIADEMQNSTPGQMLMVATRLGAGSKLVVTGDLRQSDRGAANGMADLLRRMGEHELWARAAGVPARDMRCVELDARDVMRSPAVASVLGLYDGSYRAAASEPDAPRREQACGQTPEKTLLSEAERAWRDIVAAREARHLGPAPC